MANHQIITYPALPQEGDRGYMVLLLQEALRDRIFAPEPCLLVDGRFGAATAAAVSVFQAWKLLLLSAGKVDQTTWRMLGLSLPNDDNLAHRVHRFIRHVQRRYAVTVSETSRLRRPEDAQLWHTCHMFLYNRFKDSLPKAVGDAREHAAKGEIADTGRTIPWAYLSRPDLNWPADEDWGWKKLLRTKSDMPPVKGPDQKSWAADQQPDEEATRKRARKILADAAIGTPPHGIANSVQVAPGYNGCREPCLCGRNRSRHIVGEAVDLSAIDEVANRLEAEGIGTLDDCLACFGLWRPLLHLGDSEEQWHVEEIPLTPFRAGHR
ncbi:MAG: peptidoglycan-binding protein [Tepidisphaerales bacterium]